MPTVSSRSTRPVALAVVLAGLALLGACGDDVEDDVATDEDRTVQSAGSVTVQLDVASDDDAVIDRSEEVVRRRLRAIGAGGADVTRNGSTLAITVPTGDEDLVRATLRGDGALEFRPVLAVLGVALSGPDAAAAETRVEQLRVSLGLPEDVTAAQLVSDEQELQTGPDAVATTPSGAFNRWGVDVYAPEFAELFQLEGQVSTQLTPRAAQEADAEVTVTGADGTLYLLGPVALDNTSVTSATAARQGNDEWAVNPVLSPGEDDLGAFNSATAQCFAGEPTCPRTVGGRGQLAIVVDGVVVSAPSINQASFEADSITISGGFDATSAMALAAALDAGAAPSTWTVRD